MILRSSRRAIFNLSPEPQNDMVGSRRSKGGHWRDTTRRAFALATTLPLLLLLCACGAPSSSSDLKVETYIYKATDVCALQADVYRPAAGEVFPAILWIHPGGLITGHRSWISSEQLELYLEAGYVVASIDYRPAPESKLPAILEDILDAFAWIQAEGPGLFGIDRERIAIVGHSAGGYLALLASTRLESKPAAVISFYGYGTISGPWLSQPGLAYQDRSTISRQQISDAVGEAPNGCTPKEASMDLRFEYYVYTRQHGIWPLEVTGHDPMSDPEWFAAYEPVHSITAGFPPTMLLHGEQDRDVPFEQSAQLVQALQDAGVEYQWITNPAWGHVFDDVGLDDAAVHQAFDKVVAFLDRHLK